jgi:hypothetical protein
MNKTSFWALAIGLAAVSISAQAAPKPDRGQGAERSAAAHSNGHGNDDVIHAPPPPVYPTFDELTGTQTLSAAGLAYRITPGPGGTRIVASDGAEVFGSGVVATYDPATGNVAYAAPDGMADSFTDANIASSSPNSTVYIKPITGGVSGGSFTVPSVAGVPLTYTRAGTLFVSGPTGTVGHSFVMGVPTVAGDVPKSGSATYTAVIGGSAYLAASPVPLSLAGTSSATFAADFGAGTIATDITLIGTPNVPGGAPVFLDTLVGTGSLGAVKPGFAGTFVGTGTVAGEFAGAFFGPQAAEFGYSFVAGGTGSAGPAFTAVGSVFGAK